MAMPSLLNEQTQYVDDGGKPIVNGSLFIGVQNADPVLNPISIFSDRELTIALANPQLLDAEGRTANKIWVDGRYSMKVEDVNEVQQYQELDNGEETSTGITRLGNVQGGDAITAEASATITAYIDLQEYVLGIVQTNTTNVTLNIDDVDPKPVKKNVSDELLPGDFVAGQRAIVIYNAATDLFQWVNRDTVGLPNGYVSGGLITKNATDDQNFNVSSGTAADSTNSVSMALQAFTKRADTAWSIGELGGALLDGSFATNTAYDIWAILTISGLTTDYGIDTVANGITNIPTGYLLSRKIGRLFTDENANILPEIFSVNDRGFQKDYWNNMEPIIAFETTAITSVTDSTGAAQFNFSGPTLSVGEVVNLSGFTTNDEYNGSHVVVVTGPGTFELSSVTFGNSETGSFNSQIADTVSISGGEARGTNNTADLIGAAMTKVVGTTWELGDGNGGDFTTIGSNTDAFLFAILNDTDGVVDYGFDTSPVAANIPSGYTNYKLLAEIQTDSSGDLFVINGLSKLIKTSRLIYRTVNNTDGQDFTQGAWITMLLNSEINNDQKIIGLSSNQFTLGSGTHSIEASGGARAISNQDTTRRIRVKNMTDNVVVFNGAPFLYNSAGSGGAGNTNGTFKVEGLKDFEIQLYTTNFLDAGIFMNNGEDEIWTVLEHTRLGD